MKFWVPTLKLFWKSNSGHPKTKLVSCGIGRGGGEAPLQQSPDLLWFIGQLLFFAVLVGQDSVKVHKLAEKMATIQPS